MNNEQTQAEKLADEIAFERAVDWWENDSPSPSKLKAIIAQAITQATAELRAEVERLNNVPMPSSGQILKCEACKPFYREFMAGDAAKAKEIERLEAQVAALVRAIESSICLTHSGGPLVLKITFSGPVLYQIDVDTQATADAHDARVKEAAIRECIKVAENAPSCSKCSGVDDSIGSIFCNCDSETIKALQALLPGQSPNKYRPENFPKFKPVPPITQEEARARLFAGLKSDQNEQKEGV